LMLAAAQGCEVHIRCEGEGAEASVDAIEELFRLGFHELKS
jgi:phosphotransferase system HPr-like phosphotransfer protein